MSTDQSGPGSVSNATSRSRRFRVVLFGILIIILALVLVLQPSRNRNSASGDPADPSQNQDNARGAAASGSETTGSETKAGGDVVAHAEGPGRELVSDEDTPDPGFSMELYGVVRDVQGNRRAGVNVYIRSLAEAEQQAGIPGGPPGPPMARGETREDGSFLFTKIPLKPVLIVASSNDAAPAVAVVDKSMLVVRPRRVGPLNLQLKRGVELFGRVFYHDGSPGAGAFVGYELSRSSNLNDQFWSNFGAHVGAVVQADARGMFRLQNVPYPEFGDIYLVATRGDDCGVVTVVPEPWPRSTDIQIQLSTPPVAHGVVTDEDSRPVVGALVGFGHSRVRTGREGAFAIRLDPRDAVSPGPLIVRARGFAWHVQTIDPAVVIARQLTIKLTRGFEVSGRIVNRRGEPAAGALVFAEGFSLAAGQLLFSDPAPAFASLLLHALETARVRADGSGNFTIPNLPGEKVVLIARAGGVPATSEPKVVVPPAQDITIEIPESPHGFGSMEGRVVDRATRQAITKFRMFAITTWGNVEALTDGEGNFRFDRVPAGRMRLRIEPRAGGGFQRVERYFSLEAGEARRDLQLEAGGEGKINLQIEFEGSIVTDSNVAAALLPLEGDAIGDNAPATARQGQKFIQFEDVPPGLYGIALTEGSYTFQTPVRVRLLPGQDQVVRASVVRGEMLMIAVRPRDDSPTVAGYGIRVHDSTSGGLVYDKRPFAARVVASAGALVRLPTGNYRVTVDRGDQTIAEQQVMVRDGDNVVIFEIDADPAK